MKREVTRCLDDQGGARTEDQSEAATSNQSIGGPVAGNNTVRAADHRACDWATISTILPPAVIDQIGLREHDQDQALWMLRVCNALVDAAAENSALRAEIERPFFTDPVAARIAGLTEEREYFKAELAREREALNRESGWTAEQGERAQAAEAERDALRKGLNDACLCAACAAKYEEISGEPHRQREIAETQARLGQIAVVIQRLPDTERERDVFRVEVEQLRETNARLNRRAQMAEGALRERLRGPDGPGGRPFGRSLANAAAVMWQRDAEQARAALRLALPILEAVAALRGAEKAREVLPALGAARAALSITLDNRNGKA